MMTQKAQRETLSRFVRKLYETYFSRKVDDQNRLSKFAAILA